MKQAVAIGVPGKLGDFEDIIYTRLMTLPNYTLTEVFRDFPQL
jgi:hypothetical protein